MIGFTRAVTRPGPLSMRLRTALLIVVNVVALGIGLFAANAASAQATIDGIWVETTGDGIPGFSLIEAAFGDILTLEIRIPVDAAGFAGASISVRYPSSALTGLVAVECPGPPNDDTGFCNLIGSSNPSVYTPVAGGVTVSNFPFPGTMASFDTIVPAGVPVFFPPGEVVIGAALFEVSGVFFQGDFVEIGFFDPLADGFLDGDFVDISASIPIAIARVVPVPEPSPMIELLGGSILLMVLGRRGNAPRGLLSAYTGNPPRPPGYERGPGGIPGNSGTFADFEIELDRARSIKSPAVSPHRNPTSIPSWSWPAGAYSRSDNSD